MNSSAIRSTNDAWLRLSGRATKWMLGTGLLSLHATIFTLSIVGMVFWNIYDSPNDLWVDEVFVRWGVVLAFHAIAVAAGWTAWRLMRAEQRAIDAARTTWAHPILPASTSAVSPERWQAGAPAQQVAAAPTPGLAKRAYVSYTAWSATIARRTKDVVVTSATKLSSARSSAQSATEGTPPASIQSWPEGPIRLREDEEAFIARFGTQNTSSVWSATARDLQAPDVSQETAEPSAMKESGQSWVEAATGNWITHKDDQPAADIKPTNGHMPAAPQEPDVDDSSSDASAQP